MPILPRIYLEEEGDKKVPQYSWTAQRAEGWRGGGGNKFTLLCPIPCAPRSRDLWRSPGLSCMSYPIHVLPGHVDDHSMRLTFAGFRAVLHLSSAWSQVTWRPQEPRPVLHVPSTLFVRVNVSLTQGVRALWRRSSGKGQITLLHKVAGCWHVTV